MPTQPASSPLPRRSKRLHIHFLRSPVEVEGRDGRAVGLKLERTRLEPAGEGAGQRAVGTGARPARARGGPTAGGGPAWAWGRRAGLPRCLPAVPLPGRLAHAPTDPPAHPPAPGEHDTIPADLVLKSIGFKSVGVEGAAFDARAGVVPNKLGQARRAGAAC